VLYAGGEVLYAGTLLPADLAEKMQTRGVTSMIAVPALYRTLKKTVESLYASAAHFRVRQNLARAVPHRWRQFLFPELRRVAGHRVRRFICGGSPLDRDTFRFFNFLGAPIYQGYGLTETSPVVAVNGPRANRAESVGPPLPGTEVAIAADGEILVRGPQVMRGYYNAPELTAETIDADGRLHTGDLGTIEDGFLYVTGRLKELIVLADGRKVQPQEVESAIGQCALVKEVCVVPVEGERGEEVCAIVVSAAPSQDVERDVRKLVTQLRDFKRPHRILVRSEELPKTRTMKVRRKEVQNWATQRIGTPDS
ncbi:MAG TPA: AMP-binding protein, partial [Thermoanaerobaculia bacterium]